MSYNTDLLVNNFLDEDQLEAKAFRDGFGEAIVEIAENDERVVLLNADLPSSLRLDQFMTRFPERYIQVGVAEQALASLGTGLALYGKTPVITSYAAFSPALNWSQIRLATLSRANLKIVSSHYGLNVGEDGPTAQMTEDIALMRVLPEMTVVSPADFNQTKVLLKKYMGQHGMLYFRVTRAKFPVFLNPNTAELAEPTLKVRDGNAVSIVVTGSLSYEAVQATKLLADAGVESDLLIVSTIKPLENQLIKESLAKTNKLVLIEEHQIAGGFGSAVLESLSKEGIPPTLQIAIDNQFGRSGNGYELLKLYGLDRISIANKIKAFFL
jgi:transketolase